MFNTGSNQRFNRSEGEDYEDFLVPGITVGARLVELPWAFSLCHTYCCCKDGLKSLQGLLIFSALHTIGTIHIAGGCVLCSDYRQLGGTTHYCSIR